ncbi:MAG: NlpC/P60 family protein [Planctomycetota bacterium]
MKRYQDLYDGLPRPSLSDSNRRAEAILPRWKVLLSGIFFSLVIFADASFAQSSAVKLGAEDVKFFQKLGRKIEPDLKGNAARLNQYVRFYEKELANDARLFAFNVQASADGEGPVTLSGHVEFPEHRDAIEKLLITLGFSSVKNQIAMLPDPNLGAKRFGVVRVANSLSYDSPNSKEVVTECLLGEPLFLLKKVGDYYLTHAGEGYLGYVAANDVLLMSEKQFTSYMKTTRGRLLRDKEFDNSKLPAGALLEVISTDDGETSVVGVQGEMPHLNVDDLHHRDRSKEIDKVVGTGMKFIGTRYLWGGKTSAGIDCSGLVQVAYGASGFHLPRDSNQQVYLGRLSATRWCPSTMQRGDTMYFLGSRGRIRHTAIYLGDDQYLQAESPVACITSLNPEDKNYDARRHATFAFAKRLID